MPAFLSKSALVIFTLFALAACMYDPEIKQGKSISTHELQQLKLKMTQEQVKSLLGMPLIQTQQNKHQWRYVSASSHRKKQTLDMLILSFKNNKLTKIEKKRIRQKLSS